MEAIMAVPDYAGKNTRDDSIEFTKEYILDGEFVKLARLLMKV